VLAALPGGEKRTVVIGAHLDSVREGAGINDNGSGSAAVLEAALRMAGSPAAARLRFAFWGAEERGLLGSRHHVAALSDDERRAIGLYLNLDMVGSPNFGRFVQGPAVAPETLSGAARRALVSYFNDRALPVEQRTGARPRGVGSDDASFADKGIPTLGLYTGAGEPKSEAHAALFGGSAGVPYDPCYHRACDSVENVSAVVLEQMTAALVHALGTLAHPNPLP
jgi:Zn-dependent M28 family amino/carboxypeptidase